MHIEIIDRSWNYLRFLKKRPCIFILQGDLQNHVASRGSAHMWDMENYPPAVASLMQTLLVVMAELQEA